MAEPVRVPATSGRVLLRLLLLAVLILAAGLLLAASLAPSVRFATAAVRSVDRELFDFPPLPAELGEPPERSVVLARDGSVLALLHDVENRDRVSLHDVPVHVQHAVLATEDADFFSHDGVDWRAVARAAVGNVQAGRVTSGASTITQQLVKNILLGDDSRTLERKLREAVYATQLERRLSKRQILARYLNLAYFGHGVYGIGTAADYYFGVPVSELGIDQGALLAGLIRAPAANDPVDHPRAALARRNIVLGQMADAGFLSRRAAERLRARKLRLDHPPPQARGRSFFVAYVRHLLRQEPALGSDPRARDLQVLRGGLTIRTTLDPQLQRIARRAITTVMRDRDGPQASLTAVDPRSGAIVALGAGPAGFGRGPGRTQVTPAVPGLGSPHGRQAGSAFKAFMLVAALEDGISPAYMFPAKTSYRTRNPACRSGGEPYEPGNYADASQAGWLDMADATAQSSNTYFARLVDMTGPAKLADVAARMGVSADLEARGGPFCSHVLGTKEVFGLDMASGFATLANQGVHCEPYAIAEIVDRTGRTLLRRDQRCQDAVEPGIAARATALLRGPIDSGTASSNGHIGRPAAGKTGTTDDYGNAWFAGYVPQLSAAAWVGHPNGVRRLVDRRCQDGLVTGGCLPTMIWADFMRRSVAALDLPIVDFPAPPPLPKAAVPPVVGRDRSEAETLIRRAQFRPQAATVTDHRPAGRVLSQHPADGRRVAVGSTVRLQVSDGRGVRPQVPDLVGVTRAQAEALLSAVGLTAAAVDVPVGDPARYGVVVAQTPSAGGDATRKPVVVVAVGRAPTTAERALLLPPTRTRAEAPRGQAEGHDTRKDR